MYDNLGNPNLFSGAPNADGFYDDIEIITGIGQNGSLRLRMGELSDLGINGITKPFSGKSACSIPISFSYMFTKYLL